MNGYKPFCTSYSITSVMNRVEQLEKIQSEALALFRRKNADYGDAFAKYGVIGVLMRIEDKIQRALSITKNGINLVNDEGIRDTLLDLHNYAAMALMLLDENEPEDNNSIHSSITDDSPAKYSPKNIVGGWTTINSDSPELQAAVQFACESKYQNNLIKYYILSAAKQVVSGINYCFTVSICHKHNNDTYNTMEKFIVWDHFGSYSIRSNEIINSDYLPDTITICGC